MTRWNPLVALILSLCLMLGAVGEAFARGQMLGMTDLVLCGAEGQVTVTLDANGQPVQRHPCTHCLAAGHLALLVPHTASPPLVTLRSVVLRPALALWHLSASTLAPLARGPPDRSV